MARSSMYREIIGESFPGNLEISFIDDDRRQTLCYEKMTWDIDGTRLGLRYGENPDQPAALYRLVNGNLNIGEVVTVEPGRYLASDAELIQSGKHPGKINLTDVDAALGILRYFTDGPCAVVVKHNNPSGVALGDTISHAYERALMADRIAAFGGAVVLNREVDIDTAEIIASGYTEVVAAPEFATGSVDVLKKRKNLRIMRIARIDKLADYKNTRFIEYKSLIDGGIVAQLSFVPVQDAEAFEPAPGIGREPTPEELADMKFGWLVESGVTSNSVLYVKNGVTLGIGTGEQDRVGVAEIARSKAIRNTSDRICFEKFGMGWLECEDEEIRKQVEALVQEDNGGLDGSVMISDAFFPKKDGVEVGLQVGVRAILQPGGSIKDKEVVAACNEYKATMCYTGQRSFKH